MQSSAEGGGRRGQGSHAGSHARCQTKACREQAARSLPALSVALGKVPAALKGNLIQVGFWEEGRKV